MTAARLRALHRALGIPLDYGRTRRLRAFREATPSALVRISRHPENNRPIRLIRTAAAAWQRMHAAAQDDGLTLIPLSGFRSVARQTEIIRAHLAAGRALDEILTLVAAPGFSEHHTGRAIDITAPDDPPLAAGFALTPAFAWLSQRAAAFGFHLSFPRQNPHGIAFEPWHWCWRF